MRACMNLSLWRALRESIGLDMLPLLRLQVPLLLLLLLLLLLASGLQMFDVICCSSKWG